MGLKTELEIYALSLDPKIRPDAYELINSTAELDKMSEILHSVTPSISQQSSYRGKINIHIPD
jgi:hypothetical protein